MEIVDDRSSEMTSTVDSVSVYDPDPDDASRLRAQISKEKRSPENAETSASSTNDQTDSFSSYAISRDGSTHQLLRNVSMGSFGISAASSRPLSSGNRNTNSQRNFMGGSSQNLWGSKRSLNEKREENREKNAENTSKNLKNLAWESNELKEEKQREENRDKKEENNDKKVENVVEREENLTQKTSFNKGKPAKDSKIFGIRVSSSWKKQSSSTVDKTSNASSSNQLQKDKPFDHSNSTEKVQSELLDKMNAEQRSAYLKKEESENKVESSAVSVIIENSQGSQLSDEKESSLKSEKKETIGTRDNSEPDNKNEIQKSPSISKKNDRKNKEKKDGGCCTIS
eukprot:TRINITY_DN334_c0_g1_i2.p1 TRINITY_DN334_c0_g1~~TRINITY_DN334_c0_g1_i2.p1  ORF type:complete len:361 (-),score=134.53 TRINITY_DN334_c0_g1_i2:1261-2283(-)